MRTSLLFLLAAVWAATLPAQTVITLTEDLVLSETLVVREDTRYEGNGFSLICEGCNPAIIIEKNVTAHFENVRFPKVYQRWLKNRGCEVTWNSPVMRGYIRRSNCQ